MIYMSLRVLLPLAIAAAAGAECTPTDFAGHPAPTRKGPRDVAVADVDQDGDLDLAVANHVGTTGTGDQLSILINDGAGNFVELAAYQVPGNGAQAVALGDLDNDGDADAVVAEENWDSIVVFRNNGAGVFGDITEHGHMLPPLVIANDVVLGDLDGNGFLDIVSTGLHLSVIMNNDGVLAPETAYENVSSYGVALGDIDGDGDLDVTASQFNGTTLPGPLLVWKNNGKGDLSPATAYDAGWSPSSVDLADADGDGDLDAVVANWFSGFVRDTYVISIMLNDGTGAFAVDAEYEAGDRCRTARFADMNNDGSPDVTVSNNVGDSMSVLINVGDGTLLPQLVFPAGDGNWGHAVGDWDGDGSLDIATADYLDDGMTVLMNLCQPTPSCATDLDGDGSVDGADLGGLLGAWGDCPGCTADLDGNGMVDGADLGLMLGQWGPCR